jgi:phage recombination protein Bet
MGNARQLAIAEENRQIDESTARAVAAAKPRNALEAMATRLSVSAGSLKTTLMQTAFRGCSESEFVALVIVANEYELNPLLREIYAFPKKGGGIQAIVGYDGWIKIANRHPQYDGIEFYHVEDEKGAMKAVEGVLYRKDRSHPTKKMVYLKEFKRNTEPWNNQPNHMLDVRCFCHTVRLGLGVSLCIEGDEEATGLVIDGPAEIRTLPNRKAIAEDLGDEIPAFDGGTGEIKDEASPGLTEIDEEAARALDAGEHLEGRPDTDMGEGFTDDTDAEESPSAVALSGIRVKIAAAKNLAGLKHVDAEWVNARAAYDDETVAEVDGLLAARRGELAG